MNTSSYILLSCLLAVLLITSIGCVQRFSCDSSDSKKMGTIDYSPRFQSFNRELTTKSMVFVHHGQRNVLERNEPGERLPKRLNDHVICEKIDIKPVYAYAYYEYPNQDRAFFGDSLGVVMEPAIAGTYAAPEESLYISAGGIKGRVPISGVDTTITYEPYGELFTYRKSITLDGHTLKDVWVFEKQDDGIYYHRQRGLVALKKAGRYLFRE